MDSAENDRYYAASAPRSRNAKTGNSRAPTPPLVGGPSHFGAAAQQAIHRQQDQVRRQYSTVTFSDAIILIIQTVLDPMFQPMGPIYQPSYAECLASNRDFLISVDLDDFSLGQAIFSIAGCVTNDDGSFKGLSIRVCVCAAPATHTCSHALLLMTLPLACRLLTEFMSTELVYNAKIMQRLTYLFVIAGECRTHGSSWTAWRRMTPQLRTYVQFWCLAFIPLLSMNCISCNSCRMAAPSRPRALSGMFLFPLWLILSPSSKALHLWFSLSITLMATLVMEHFGHSSEGTKTSITRVVSAQEILMERAHLTP